MKIKEKEGYRILKRDDMVDDLIRWISESQRESDRFLMKEDLKMLMNWDCEYIYSSDSTNDYEEINA